MKVILFIGQFKTGSTSLQRFLSRNYVALIKAGILYPSVESQGISQNMAALLRGADSAAMSAKLNVTEPHNALALQLKTEEDGHGIPSYYENVPSGFQMLEMIDNQIAAFNPKTVLICSEVFALFSHTEKQASIARLARRLGHHDVTLYANLRRPDDYLSSWHRQRLKFGAKMQPLRTTGLNEYLHSSHVQHGQMIEAWLQHFPNAQIKMRNFDDFIGKGGIIQDFGTHAGVDFPPDLANPGDFNPSVPCAFAEVGRQALIDLPHRDGRIVVDNLLKAIQYVRHVADKDVEMFGQSNRATLSEAYAPSLAIIQRLTGQNNFFSHEMNLKICRPISDLDALNKCWPDLQSYLMASDLPQSIKGWVQAYQPSAG